MGFDNDDWLRSVFDIKDETYLKILCLSGYTTYTKVSLFVKLHSNLYGLRKPTFVLELCATRNHFLSLVYDYDIIFVAMMLIGL